MAQKPNKPNTDRDNKQVLTKATAMEICNWPMQQILEIVCGHRDYDIELPPGADAAQVASQLGGTVVADVETDVVRAVKSGARARIITVRITVGILTSTMQANALPKQLVRIEATAPSVGLSRIAPAVTGEIGAVDFVQISKEIGATERIVGESIKASAKDVVTKASGVFQVMANFIQIWQLAQDAREGRTETKNEELVRSACCIAIARAQKKAWDSAPKTFHQKAWKTDDRPGRFNGKKKSRRN